MTHLFDVIDLWEKSMSWISIVFDFNINNKY